MRKVKHPNIIQYYSSFYDQEALYIVMEYAEGGDLHEVLIVVINLVLVHKEIKEEEKTLFREGYLVTRLGFVQSG